MKKCFKDKNLVNDKLYDINQIFKTEEEIKDLNEMFYSFIILQDIIDFPEKYTEEEIKLSLEFVDFLFEYTNEISNLLNDQDVDNFILNLERLLDVFILGENRLQELDDYTILFVIKVIKDILSFYLKSIKASLTLIYKNNLYRKG